MPNDGHFQEQLGRLGAKRARLQAYQNAQVQYAEIGINTANSEATIKQYWLRFTEYDIELGIAMNNLQQELARLDGLKTRVMKTGSRCSYSWFHFCSVSRLGAHRI